MSSPRRALSALRGAVLLHAVRLVVQVVQNVARPAATYLGAHAATRRVATIAATLLFTATMFAATMPVTQAGYSLRYVRGYSVQGSWLCYGWSNGIYHCTQHWTRSGGRYISYNSPFVPSQSSGTTTTATAYRAPAPVVSSSTNVYTSRYDGIEYCGAQRVDFSNASQWATPHGCYGQIFYPRSSLGLPSFGWCNWAAEASHTNYPGYMALSLAKHYGAPRLGAVVWFSPFDQGASSDGHWANLVAIGPNGWGLVEEMNFYYRGGGWAKIDFRFIRMYQAGTAYLYA